MLSTPDTDHACRVVISQPMYFPWPGFLEHMALADVFIWLDDAQFSRRSFTKRVQVKLNDERKWMSIPLFGSERGSLILELQTEDSKWKNDHRNLLSQSIGKAQHREFALKIFDEAVFHNEVIEIIIASAEGLARAVGVLPPTILRSSAMDVSSTSWRRILDLVKQVGGTTYVTGHGAAGYLEHEAFEAEGISVEYMNYSYTSWPQAGNEFTPYVTALDLIAAVGDKGSSYLKPQKKPWREFLASKGLPY